MNCVFCCPAAEEEEMEDSEHQNKTKKEKLPHSRKYVTHPKILFEERSHHQAQHSQTLRMFVAVFIQCEWKLHGDNSDGARSCDSPAAGGRGFHPVQTVRSGKLQNYK